MRIAVLVSGGVDSSVALALLKSQGHEVTAFYLKIWLEDELSYLADCPWETDLAFVRSVCAQLDVPLEVVSLQQEYRDEVVGYTIREVQAGRTPNPDILCNKRIKFGLFLDKIDASYEKVATGHYAQIHKTVRPEYLDKARQSDPSIACPESIEGRGRFYVQNPIYELHMAPDPIKDQTYFLSHLSQEQLARAMFPIGHLSKPEVRELAAKFNLPNKDRKDSQGICFLGKFKYRDFIKHYLGEKPGDLIEHETGKKLGEHEGFWFYTVGQRQGIRLSGGPWYVVAKDCAKNIVFISREYYSEEKTRNSFFLDNLNWIGIDHLPVLIDPSQAQGERGEEFSLESHKKNLLISELDQLPVRPELAKDSEATREWVLKVKMRHGPDLKDCTVQKIDNETFQVKLSSDDQGIASGQYAVFYEGTRCLGSGVIR